MKKLEIKSLKGKIHIAILTVVEEELVAVLKCFPSPDYADGRRRYAIGSMRARDGYNYLYAVVRCPAQGPEEAKKVTRDLRFDLDPKLVILVGIGGAVPSSDFTLGDVICAIELLNYPTLELRPEQVTFSERGGGPMDRRVEALLANLPHLQQNLETWNAPEQLGDTPPVPIGEELDQSFTDKDKDWNKGIRNCLNALFPEGRPGRLPIATARTIGSGNILHKAPRVLKPLRIANRNLAVMEMELGGVYEAVHDDPPIPVLAVKGISDVVGLKRDDLWKVYAAKSAASFARSLVRAGELREILLDQAALTAMSTKLDAAPGEAWQWRQAVLGPWTEKLNAAFKGDPAYDDDARIVSILSSEPILKPKGDYPLPPGIDEEQLKRSREYYSHPSRENQYHAVLTTSNIADVERPIFEYFTLDYAALRVLEKAGQKVSGLYAGALVCCSAQQKIYLHRRSQKVDRHRDLLHTMSGNFCPRGDFRADKDLRGTASREIYEEMHAFIDVDASRYPTALIHEPFSGRWLLSYLGVDITRTAAEHVRGSDEGEPEVVSFADLGSKLHPRAEWVQSGLLNVLVWLALGARVSGGAGPGFDPYIAKQYLEQWFEKEGLRPNL